MCYTESNFDKGDDNMLVTMKEMLTDAKKDVSEYERKFGLRGKV